MYLPFSIFKMLKRANNLSWLRSVIRDDMLVGDLLHALSYTFRSPSPSFIDFTASAVVLLLKLFK